MRAYEFITEGVDPEQVGWQGALELPSITAWRDEMRQLDRGRNALTTMPIPKQGPELAYGADSPFVTKPKPVVKRPEGWESSKPNQLVPNMIDPKGNVQLGPDKVAQPGTEDYALLKKRLDPETKGLRPFTNPSTYPNKDVDKKLQQRQQQIFKPSTLDKGKEVTWPSNRPYQMIDPLRRKYRT
ncbi:MAG: hypothetical protein ACOVLB_08505 [Candidatus Nanopelagicus sp.]